MHVFLKARMSLLTTKSVGEKVISSPSKSRNPNIDNLLLIGFSIES
jgi:hypothetical protein